MSSPVTVQANKLWQLLTASSTASSYKQAIEITGTILKETVYLLWLVFCLVLVAGEWLWHRSIATGRNTRTWVENMGKAPAEPSDPGQTATQLWQNLLVSSQTASQSLLAKARQQLDLPPTPPATQSAPLNVAAPAPKLSTPPASSSTSAPINLEE
jgi:hypothetical protein